MATVTGSKQFSLNFRDIVKGLAMAVILPVVNVIYQSIEAGSFEFDWKRIGLLAAGGFIAYIIKNFLTPAEITVTNVKPETIEAVKDGTADVKVITK
jgi:large-conductance mechanosensitive channel